MKRFDPTTDLKGEGEFEMFTNKRVQKINNNFICPRKHMSIK